SAASETFSPATQRRFAARLRGDLDAIVMKCLRKRAEDRYPGMEAFADDLDAWRKGATVAARRGDRWYRVRRHAAKHWAALATGSAVLALTIAFIIGLAHELRATEAHRDRAAHEQRRAESLQLRAESERERALQVTRFMVELFGEADPRQARGTEPSVRQALDRGVARLTTELLDYPATRSHLLRELAEIYGELGDHASSLALARQSESIARAASVDASGLMHSRYALARALHDAGQLQPALSLLEPLRREAAARHDRALGFDILNRMGLVERDLDHHARAQSLQLELADELLSALGVPDLAAANALPVDTRNRDVLERVSRNAHNRCMAPRDPAARAAALLLCRQTLVLKDRLHEPDHPSPIPTAIEIAIIEAELGNVEDSIASNREIIERSRRVFGAEHFKVAFPMVNLANDLATLGRFDEAEPLMRDAVAIFRKALGDQHHWTVEAQGNLRLLLEKAGRAETRQDALPDIRSAAPPVEPGR
ncbi:MAG: tetratricopeptide repeat-containing protein kinase family protein, partial [Lysobacterales bacterium]